MYSIKTTLNQGNLSNQTFHFTWLNSILKSEISEPFSLNEKKLYQKEKRMSPCAKLVGRS